MKTETPSIDCPHCDGSGKLKLSPGYARVLELLRRGPATAVELSKIVALSKLSPTALNNRLEYLRANKLADRTREGRAWRYHAL